MGATTISFRLDEAARRALDELTADGTSVSAAVRVALVEAAARRARSRLRDEVVVLAGDEVDRAEAAQVLREMEELRS